MKFHYEIGEILDNGETMTIFSDDDLETVIKYFCDNNFNTFSYFIDMWNDEMCEPIGELDIRQIKKLGERLK